MADLNKTVCPDCEVSTSTNTSTTSRREFLATTVLTVVAAGAAIAGVPSAKAYASPIIKQTTKAVAPESLVKTLYSTLTPAQKTAIAMPWDHEKRKVVNANWAIVEPTIGKTFTMDQQEIIKAILKGVSNEEWFPKFMDQMKNDGGGFENYHCAIFGDPTTGKSEWVMTGRHMTMRAGGDPSENMAFGGPIFYGHAPKETEDAGHPGNLFWFQAKRANHVFDMLDSKQRDRALIALAPDESAIQFRKKQSELPGIAVSELSHDQKNEVSAVVKDLLAPYRPKDVKEVMEDLKLNGGLDALHLSFYKQDDLGMDGVWDIWRLEGPAFVWHFRGAPHVHTWVNIGKKA